MQPAHKSFGWVTTDLTQGIVCRLFDQDTGGSRLVAYFPKRWEKNGPKSTANVVNGPTDVQAYKVLEWEEIELAVKP